MKIPYPPFSGDDTSCPKCTDSMGKRWMPPSAQFVQGVGAVLGGGPGHEWLLRECGGCGYQWPEMCADTSGIAREDERELDRLSDV